MIFKLLFAAAIVAMPFNDLPYFYGFLKEIGREGSFYPLFLATIVAAFAVLYKIPVKIPRNRSFFILGIFLLWLLISGFSNLPALISSETKGRVGIIRFINQNILIYIGISFSLLTYNLFRKRVITLADCRRYFLFSFIIAGAYSIIEIYSYLGNLEAINILTKINYFIHDEPIDVASWGRLRSVSGEASWFGTYSAVCFPWLFTYLFTSARRGWILFLLLIIYLGALMILSLSRTAVAVLVVEAAILTLVGFISRSKLIRFRTTVFLIVFLSLTGAIASYATFGREHRLSLGTVIESIINPLSKRSPFYGSDVGRLGSTATAFNIMMDYPLTGCGWGQYGFMMPDYVPKWAESSQEIYEYKSLSPDRPTAPIHNLYMRIAAESGLTGLFLWLCFWISVLFDLGKKLQQGVRVEKKIDWLGWGLMVSLLGAFLCGFNVDSLRFASYWILFGLSWAYTKSDEPVVAYENTVYK